MKRTTYELLVRPNTLLHWCKEMESGSLKIIRKKQEVYTKMGKKTKIIRIVTEISAVRKSHNS
jgi:arsenate reductase-like glutaredoxin family protein